MIHYKKEGAQDFEGFDFQNCLTYIVNNSIRYKRSFVKFNPQSNKEFERHNTFTIIFTIQS
jgi:hypothetical protein